MRQVAEATWRARAKRPQPLLPQMRLEHQHHLRRVLQRRQPPISKHQYEL